MTAGSSAKMLQTLGLPLESGTNQRRIRTQCKGFAAKMTDLMGENRVRFGPYEADLHTHELWKFGTRVKLVGQPFAILSVLLSKPGELVTREELREYLWPGETFVDFNHGLNAAVNKLRDVLCDSADDPKYIETLPRRGYRLIAAVERGATTPAIASTENNLIEPTPVLAVPVTSLPEHPAIGGNRASRATWPYWVAGGLVVIVLLFALFLSILKISSGIHERIARDSAVLSGPLQGWESVLVSGGKNEGAQFSPDGSKIIYMCDRGSGRNLWVSDADGRNARQLTAIGDAGTPRWSPDGKLIAFDARVHEFSAIFVVSREGGPLKVMAIGDSNNSVPSWSHDGQFIYFASDRTGRYEIWRLPAAGGEPTEVTHDGGFAAFEAPDGKALYYAKTKFPNPDLWQTDGVTEKPISPAIRPGTWASWAVNGTKIYFVQQGPGNVATLSEVDMPRQKMRQITLLPRFPFWLAVSSDERTLIFDRADTESTSSLVKLENFQR